MKALIIGGGIAGPSAAMALQRADIDATVYESHSGGADNVGIFMTLGSNGIDALRSIDADAPAVAAGFPTPGIDMVSTTGKTLGQVRTSRPDGDLTSRTLKRADLYSALRDEALRRGIDIQYGKRLVDVKDTGNGIRAIFADGTEEHGDLLIGCDGLHSTVRTLIDPTAPAPAYSGLIGLGGYTRGVPVNTPAGSYQMMFGKHAFFGYAPAPDGEVWWFVNLPRPSEPARGELEGTGAEQWRSHLTELFADDAGPAAELIRASHEILPASPVHAMMGVPAWHRGRIIAIGDAAHAPSPTSGQGASLSIEDAVELAKALRDLPTIEGAFAAYETLRRPRVEQIVKQAARINNNKAAGPIGRVSRDLMMPLILPRLANSKHTRQTYGYHIDWDTPTATTANSGAPARN
ncbi:FAD-dependent monooxygenase [Streptomyces sp. SID14478]|uniref:FAD-dependent monooxygenase n=1 Tax=Streptomyces sp. SID14478 TaxID=2706073 RepID=UPI0013DBFE60|nr:NAD(P)/FAD-dependent oxidoreductase [Streptomyces sp. SID14478]NEB74633.1 FAD-dependent monooxygenase [Streptomyces sp. SID14478]